MALPFLLLLIATAWGLGALQLLPRAGRVRDLSMWLGGALALGVIAVALKPRRGQVSHKIDYMGFVLLSGALTTLVLAASLGGNTYEWLSLEILALLGASALLLALFVFNEARAAEPVLPLALFRNNTFVVTNAVGFLVGMAMFGSITFLPMYLQLAKGVTPTDSAIQLVPMMIGLIGASTLSGFLMTRTGRYKLLPMLSTVSLIVGLVFLANMQLDTPAWQVGLFMFLIGAGIGPVNAVSVTATQNAVPHEMVGVATAGTTMFRQIGGSIGVSVFGAIFAGGLASRIGNILPGGGFNAEALAALPPPVRAEVLDAFAASLHPVFFTAAAAAGLAFLLTLLLEELPLATTLRREPEAEIDAEEAGAASVVGAPATVVR